MSNQKPVWRANTGMPPTDRLKDSPVLLMSGSLLNDNCNYYNWSFNYDECYPIYAYQTTRTKKAKYERVDCGKCDGDGVYFGANSRAEYTCHRCNGKGYTLEAIR